MSDPKPPKKSETLEIRLPYATKAAFMEQCRNDGCTASDVVRDFIQRALEAPRQAPRPTTPRWGQALVAAAAGLAVGAVAAPSLAHPAAGSRAVFNQIDRNHDGVLSFNEFHHR